MTAAEPNVAGLLRTLSPEAKEELLVGLLRELMQIQSDQGQISIVTEQGEFIGTFLPPAVVKAQSDAALAEMPPKVREAMTRPLPPDFDPDNSYTPEEADEIIRQRSQRTR